MSTIARVPSFPSSLQSSQSIDAMPLAELERRASHAHALLEQAEAMLPGVARLTVAYELASSSSMGPEDWLARRAVLSRLAKRAAQLGARLTDAAWCMEQQAHDELIEAPSARASSFGSALR